MVRTNLVLPATIFALLATAANADVSIQCFYQFDLPVAPPTLEARFALDGRCHPIVRFDIDQPRFSILSRKGAGGALAVLLQPRGQVRRHADVERAVWLVRQFARM